MINKLGGRKMILGVAVILLGVAIDFVFGLSDNLLNLITFISVGFFLGNVGEHMATSFSNRKKVKPEEDPVNQNVVHSHNILKQELDGMKTAVEEIKQTNSQITKSVTTTSEALSSIINFITKTKAN